VALIIYQYYFVLNAAGRYRRVLNATFKRVFAEAPGDLHVLDAESFLVGVDEVFAAAVEDTVVGDVQDLFVNEIERLFERISTHLCRWVGNPRPSKTRITVVREAYALISDPLARLMCDVEGSTAPAGPDLETQYTNAVDGLRAATKVLEDAEQLERADAEVRRLAAQRDLTLPTQRNESRLVTAFVRPYGCDVLMSTAAEECDIDGLLAGMTSHVAVAPPTWDLLGGVNADLPDLELGFLVSPHASCNGEMQL